jgi:hypothetical protein
MLYELQNLPGPDEVIRGLYVGLVIRDAIIVGSVMVDKVLLNHSSKAMTKLGVGKTGVEFQPGKGEPIIAN